MTEVLAEAVSQVLRPDVLLVILLAAGYGIFVGAVPGLTATMAVALMVPLTFFLDDIAAIAAIVTTVTTSIFAGDIPATLVRIPGTPASAAYAQDAYLLARQGHMERVLGLALWCSVLGGLFGTAVLAVAATPLALVARQFTSYEYFWLYVLGLTCAALVSEDSYLKGLLALLLGLLLSTVGLGTDYGVPRLTFGQDALVTGIAFIPAMIGLFGISEVLRNAVGWRRDAAVDVAVEDFKTIKSPGTLRVFLFDVVPRSAARWLHLLRSSSLGALVGMLPGAGADIAAWISYAVSRRFSRHPELYGRGSLEGLADATGANNAALGSAWIPALVFGIPGDSVTAIAIGVLLMKNITPGPGIFDSATNPEQTVLAFAIYVTFVVANLVLIPLGLLAIRAGGLLVHVPRRILLPLIVVFSIVGAYALNASYFDVTVVLGMGVVGFVLERNRIPLGPIVLGLILGGPLEHTFIQCLAKSSSPREFIARPVSVILALLVVALWASVVVQRNRGGRVA